jgi:hypothetical protein
VLGFAISSEEVRLAAPDVLESRTASQQSVSVDLVPGYPENCAFAGSLLYEHDFLVLGDMPDAAKGVEVTCQFPF